MEERRRHVSNSEIATWKRCRRKWYLSYFRRLRRKDEKLTSALQLGTRVHEELAVYYSKTPTDPVQHLVEVYTKAIIDAQMADAHPDAIKELQSEYDLAMAMVEGYMQWLEETGIDDGLTVIDSEVEMAADMGHMGSAPVTLIGKLDTRVRRESDGALFSLDHKTCGTFRSVTDLLDINEQPLTYQLLEKLTAPKDQQTVGGMLNMLRKVKRTASAKPPFYMRESVHHNDDELRTFYVRLHATLTEMMSAEDYLLDGAHPDTVVPPSPDGDCSWKCEFRAVCPMMNDPRSAAELVLQSSFVQKDPYERYTEVAHVE